MNRRCALGLCAVALITIPAFPSSSVAQGKSLKDQLVGTWIYVSSTGKREDGSAVPRPSAQGAVTYTADGRFHFITVRTEVPKYASGDPARPSPEEAMAVASGVVAYTGTYTVDESTKTAHLNIETSSVPNFVGAPNQRRIVTSITDEELKLTNPRTPAGVTLELVFKRRSDQLAMLSSASRRRRDVARYRSPVRAVKRKDHPAMRATAGGSRFTLAFSTLLCAYTLT